MSAPVNIINMFCEHEGRLNFMISTELFGTLPNYSVHRIILPNALSPLQRSGLSRRGFFGIFLKLALLPINQIFF